MNTLIALGSLGLFGVVYALCRFFTRPVPPSPGPATPDLGPESPALVNLLANRWKLTEDAAEATLLDLAARRFLELRQPGGDPRQTTVHLPENPPDDGGLRAYEKMVLDRVRGLSVGGAIPVTALTFRDGGQAGAWAGRFRKAVVAEARGMGLARRRFGPRTVALLVFAAALAAIGVAVAGHRYGRTQDGFDPALPLGFFTFLLLSPLFAAPPGEQYTPAGRTLAARWLGVRQWLRGHEQFGDLPPAAVAVWDRYLGYGAALGVAHEASTVLDLGLGDHRVVWSAFGGTWHRVRVKYPGGWPRYGRTTTQQLRRAAGFLLAGCLWVYLTRDGSTGLMLLAAWPLLTAVYIVVRTIMDANSERTLTGEVLWLRPWLVTGGAGKDRPEVPWVHYVAIDDGGDAEVTVAWGLPSGWTARVMDGDVVTAKVRPWSRRITEITVTEQGRSREVAVAVAGFLPGQQRPSSVDLPGLYTDDEVARIAGRPVWRDPSDAGAVVRFLTVEGRRPVLALQAIDGVAGGLIWRANQRGRELPGLADGAFVQPDRGVLRAGDNTILIELQGDARAAQSQLPWLLELAARRTPQVSPGGAGAG